jgi:hypothetical protein
VTAGETKRAQYRIRFAEPSDGPAVARFNERIVPLDYQVPADVRLPGEPGDGDGPTFRRLLVAEDGEEIRAAVVLQHSTILVGGAARPFCWSLLPISEGAVDRRHSMAILLLMRHALDYQPFLTAIGVGSMEEDAAQFFLRMRWRNGTIPFLFYAARPTRLLTGLRYLRGRKALRVGALAAAFTGAGVLYGWVSSRRRRRRSSRLGFDVDVVESFAAPEDELFAEHAARYGAVVRRDSAALNVLYPGFDRRYIRLRVRDRSSGENCGWVVVAHRQMRDDKYFGDLHVGTLVDGFGKPEAAAQLVSAGLEHLVGLGVDVAVANWSHEAWVDASRSAGFLPGPSNFFFFVSPAGDPLLEADCPLSQIHLTRGDGDGPESLLPEPPA